jgi:hypothetical protein
LASLANAEGRLCDDRIHDGTVRRSFSTTEAVDGFIVSSDFLGGA